MKTTIRTIAATVALVSAIALSGGAKAAAINKDPIKITIQDWTGQYISSHIMGEVLKKAGYNIEYIQADYIAQFAGLESGDLDVAMEIWETTGKDALVASLKTGKTIDLGVTGMKAKEEWWYPLYVKKKCPGLPDWRALNKCAKIFSTPGTAPKGRYLGGPVTWGGHDEERIKALGLNYVDVHAGTDAALFAELKSAYERKAPILLWIYAPHWAVTKYKGEWVKFPTYTDKCYNDPKWGVNPNMKYDCGKPFGWIKKVGWKGGEKKWPGAYKIIRNFKVNNAEMGAMIGRIDLDGEKLNAVVADWMNKNKSRWQAWIK